MQFTIKDKTFSAGFMPAIKQFHVVRRLTPLVDAAKDMLDDKAVKRLMEGGKTEDVQLSDFHLGPIASVLASLPDADFEYVVNACLDVTDPEPLPPEHPLWAEPNVIITPHVTGGFSLPKTLDNIVDIFAHNLKRYAAGQPLDNQMDRRTQYASGARLQSTL